MSATNEPARRDAASARRPLGTMALIARCASVGAVTALTLGGLVGLVLGLRSHAPTSWFAVLEVGIPAGICGAALGAVVGLVADIVRRMAAP